MQPDSLKGKRIGVPEMYLGGSETTSGVYTSDAVLSLWEKARADLEACGATVQTCSDFPAVSVYENPAHWPKDADEIVRLPDNWNFSERGSLIAHSWDDFLRMNEDPNLPSLAAADSAKLFPQLPPDHPQVIFSEVANAVHWSKLANYVEDNATASDDGMRRMYSIPNLEQAVKALERMRKVLLEDWMTANNIDFIVFPAAGDVGYAEADIDIELAKHTWKNGVKYSNGNRALRHLGIPSVTVTMGTIPGKDMPMGLTILGRAYDDAEILKAGYALQRLSERRLAPPLTPTLSSDVLEKGVKQPSLRPNLQVRTCSAHALSGLESRVFLEGYLTLPSDVRKNADPQLDIFIDGKQVLKTDVQLHAVSSTNEDRRFEFTGSFSVAPPPEQNQRNQVTGKIARDSIMVLVLARSHAESRPSGCIRLIHVGDIQN
jgi:hypothetical protein